MAVVSNLWKSLKQAPRSGSHSVGVSHWSAGPRTVSLGRVLGQETRQALIGSGAVEAMRTPMGQLRPLGIICETVNLCNSDCVFCPYGQQTRPLGTMEPELFTEVCRQYVAMGAGPLSLTPMVGDVLLDKELSHRLATLRLYRHAIQPSVTTNLYALDRHSDDTVLALLDTLVRLHISVYGITAEENAAITRRNHFGKFSSQAQRLAELWERSSKRCSVRVSFRNLYDYADDTLRRYVERHFGHPEWLQGGSSRYMNWGGSMSGSLPGDAAWVAEQRNQGTCILLATAMQVYWDGRVSACACCDYDAGQDLALGSVMDQTLTDIYNSAANQQIWAAQESGRMPSICRRCTFHVPIAQLAQRSPMGQGWFDFVGG